MKQIIHHSIKPMFDPNQDEDEIKRQKLKEYFIKKSLYKKAQPLQADPNAQQDGGGY